MESVLGVLGVFSFLVIILSIALYFLPSMIAIGKQKNNAVAIIVLNIFFGWSVIGWFIALVWSLCNDPVVCNNIIVPQPVDSNSKSDSVGNNFM
jgi:hypothetical protein